MSSDAGLSQFYEDTTQPADQGRITRSLRGDSFELGWPDVANRGTLAATWEAQVECCGRACGEVQHTWTLTNTSGAPITLEFYAYTDYDYGANFANESTSDATGTRQIVRLDPTAQVPQCVGIAEFSGDAVTSWEVADWPNIETNLLGPSFVSLADNALPFGPSDYTGALGWRRTIAPGQSEQIRYRHAHNCLDCANAGSVQNYGTSFGSMALTTADAPRAGCEMRLAIAGGVPLANAILLIGRQLNVPIGNCPQTLLVGPSLGTLPGRFNQSGNLTFDVPRTSSSIFCGLALHFQVFALVQGATCVPFEHSEGLRVVYGN